MKNEFFVGAKVIEFANDDVRYQSAIVLEKGNQRYLVTISNEHRFIISEIKKEIKDK